MRVLLEWVVDLMMVEMGEMRGKAKVVSGMRIGTRDGNRRRRWYSSTIVFCPESRVADLDTVLFVHEVVRCYLASYFESGTKTKMEKRSVLLDRDFGGQASHSLPGRNPAVPLQILPMHDEMVDRMTEVFYPLYLVRNHLILLFFLQHLLHLTSFRNVHPSKIPLAHLNHGQEQSPNYIHQSSAWAHISHHHISACNACP